MLRLACLVLALLLTSCGAATEPTTDQPIPTTPRPAPSSTLPPSPSATAAPSATVAPTATHAPTAAPAPTPTVESGPPLFLTAELVDVGSRQRFRLTDLTAEGNYVLLEMMAVWCTICLRQQEQIQLYEADGTDDVISVSFDIDPNEDAAILREHATSYGFDWRFAIAPPEVSRSIAGALSPSFLNPTGAPMVLVRPDNSLVKLPLRVKSAEQLARLIDQNRLP